MVHFIELMGVLKILASPLIRNFREFSHYGHCSRPHREVCQLCQKNCILSFLQVQEWDENGKKNRKAYSGYRITMTIDENDRSVSFQVNSKSHIGKIDLPNKKLVPFVHTYSVRPKNVVKILSID